MKRFCCLVGAAVWLLITVYTSVLVAQQSTTQAETSFLDSPQSIDATVAQMSDDEVRRIFLDYLKSGVDPDTAQPELGVTLFEKIQTIWEAFLTPAQRAFAKLPMLVGKQAEAVTTFLASTEPSGGALYLFGLMLLAVVLGLVAEAAVRHFILRQPEPVPTDPERSLADALKYLSRRFGREVLGLVIFFVVVRTFGRVVLSEEQLAFAGPFVTYLIWMPRLVAAMSRFFLAPQKAELRLVSLDDRCTGFLHRNLVGLSILGGFNIFILGFNTLHGVPPQDIGLGFWLDSAIYVYIIFIAWLARDGLRGMMLGDSADRTEIDGAIAKAFPAYMMAVAVGMWALVATLAGLGYMEPLLRGAHYSTMFWLLVLPVIDTGIRGVVRHLVPDLTGEGAAAVAAHQQTKRSYIHIGRVTAAGIVIFLIARSWGVNLVSMVENRTGVSDNLFAFLLTIVFGYLAYQGVTLWISRLLARENTQDTEADEEAEIGGKGKSRLFTVLPLILVMVRGAVIAIFGLLAIGNLGIDIAPLLAGAGVIGLALGFGAQKLVADIVSGVFFLIDDAFRVGEYVDVGGTMGSVEKISIRSMQLRHHRGPIHTIPYGEIAKLTNYSRDWVIMKLKFKVSLDTDPNQVKKIFKRIGAEMIEDPLYKDDFLQPFKSQGVFDFDDIGMIIRGKFMTKPGKQFMIRKEIYNRVKAAFAENGIAFARREVRVDFPHLPDDSKLSETEKQAVATAAADAVSAEPGPTTGG